jgi:hypothetical protein
MNSCLLKLSYLCGILSFFYWFFIKSSIKLYPLSTFPELNEGGPVGVYLQSYGSTMPMKPAYFILDELEEPIFIDLYTNQTIGSTYQYTNCWSKVNAYRKIRLTDVIYLNRRLFDHVRNKDNAINASDLLWQRVWLERRTNWWPRLVYQYEQLLEDHR